MYMYIYIYEIDGEMIQVTYQSDWGVARFKKTMIAKTIGKEELKRDEHKGYRVMWHFRIDMDATSQTPTTRRRSRHCFVHIAGLLICVCLPSFQGITNQELGYAS